MPACAGFPPGIAHGLRHLERRVPASSAVGGVFSDSSAPSGAPCAFSVPGRFGAPKPDHGGGSDQRRPIALTAPFRSQP